MYDQGEKEAALQAYDDPLASGFTAALGREMSGDIFSISLGSLPPKSEPELIDAEGGVHFALPHCSNHSIHPRDPLTLLPK